MLSVNLASVFHLRLIAHAPAIFEAIMGVDISFDVFMNVMQQGLIHFLVGTAIATSAAQWTRRASALVWIHFVVVPGTLTKVRAAGVDGH